MRYTGGKPGRCNLSTAVVGIGHRISEYIGPRIRQFSGEKLKNILTYPGHLPMVYDSTL